MDAIVHLEPAVQAVLGLGNPGPEYHMTRHNMGFLLVERLAHRHRLRLDPEGRRLEACRWRYGGGGRRTWVARPQTYMNRSGQGAAWLRIEKGLEPEGILVIVDDLDLPFGQLRLRERGGAGTHNGMRSLLEALGEGFPRLRIGIGPVPERVDVADWVLSEFTADERTRLGPVLDTAADCVEVAVREGRRAAMNRFNGTGSEGA